MVLFSIIFFLVNLVHDMGASVSFSDIQTREAKSSEDRDQLDDQMDKEAPWTVIYGYASNAWHPWSMGQREARHGQREDMERHTGGSDEMDNVFELSGTRTTSPVKRSNLCEERHHTARRGLGHDFSSSEDARGIRMYESQTSFRERLFTAAFEEAEDRDAYKAHPAEARREDAVEQGPIDEPSGDLEQPVHGTEPLEAQEAEQEAVDQFVFARHDGHRAATEQGLAADFSPGTTCSKKASPHAWPQTGGVDATIARSRWRTV